MRYLSRHLLKLAAARRIVREETDEANQLTRLHRRHHRDLGTCRFRRLRAMTARSCIAFLSYEGANAGAARS